MAAEVFPKNLTKKGRKRAGLWSARCIDLKKVVVVAIRASKEGTEKRREGGGRRWFLVGFDLKNERGEG